MGTTRRNAVRLVGVAALVLALGLGACGDDSGDDTTSAPPTDETQPAGADEGGSDGCDLTDGTEVESPEALASCTVGGETVAFATYDDCEDGSTLVVWGESNQDPEGGWVVFPAEGEAGTWTVGPWEPAWNECYGY